MIVPSSSPTGRTQTLAWLGFARTTPTARAPDPEARAAPGVRLLHQARTTVLRLLVALVLAVAALAFVASFETISAFAVAIGWPAKLRWVAPLLLDTFTLVGTLLVIWLGLTGRNPWGCVAGYYGRLLILTGTAASMIVNLDAHRPASPVLSAGAAVAGEALGAAVLAVGPPAALFLAVEALVIVSRYAMTDLAAATEQVGEPSSIAAGGSADRWHRLDDGWPMPVTIDRTDRPAAVNPIVTPEIGRSAHPAHPTERPSADGAPERPVPTGSAGDSRPESPLPETAGHDVRPAPATDRPSPATGQAAPLRDRLAAAIAAGRPDGTPWTNRTLAVHVGCAPSTAGAFLRTHRTHAEERAADDSPSPGSRTPTVPGG